jgi:hypothetical protein
MSAGGADANGINSLGRQLARCSFIFAGLKEIKEIKRQPSRPERHPDTVPDRHHLRNQPHQSHHCREGAALTIQSGALRCATLSMESEISMD